MTGSVPVSQEPDRVRAAQSSTEAERIEKLAKWLDFQFGGPQIGDQVRAIGAALADARALLAALTVTA